MADESNLIVRGSATLRDGPVVNLSDQAWLINKQYQEGDVTIFNDCLYFALQASVGSQPDTSPLDWKLLSAKNSAGGNREIVVDFSNVTGDTQNEVVSGGPDMNGNETYTFTLAQNVTDLKFIIIGAGGGGGNGNNGANQPTGGGGGSGYLTEFNVGNGTSGDAYDLVIGLAGANSTAGNASSVTMGMNSATALGGSPGTSGITGFPDIGGNGGDGGNGGGGGFKTADSIVLGGDGGNGAYNGGGGGSGSPGGNGGTGGTGETGANGCRASPIGGGPGGNSLGGRGGDNEQGGEGGASPSPITAVDSSVATSRKGRPGSDSPTITTLVPELPGGGGGGGGNGDIDIRIGSSGSPGRVIINYNF